MLPVATKNAPNRVGTVIASYKARWFLLGLIAAMLVLFGVFIWIVPLAGDNPTREKLGLIAILVGFMLVMSAVQWAWPTYSYKKLKAQGYILEITDRELIRSIHSYYGVLDEMLRAAKAQEVQKLDGLLPEVYALAQTDRLAARARITAELDRLRAATPR